MTEKGEYGVGVHGPWANLVTHLRPLWGPGPSHASGDVAGQTVLVMVMVLAAVVVSVVGWFRSREVGALDLVLLLAGGAMWTLPYIAGGTLSVYRAEGCVVVLVPLLRRLPTWLLVPLLGASVVVAYLMSGWFYRDILL